MYRMIRKATVATGKKAIVLGVTICMDDSRSADMELGDRVVVEVLNPVGSSAESAVRLTGKGLAVKTSR